MKIELKSLLKKVRSGLILLLILYILLSPSARQVFGYRHPLFREWVMFSGVGRDICRGQFTTGPRGTGNVINRLATLGYSSIFSAPRSVRLWRGEQEAVTQGREICLRVAAATGEVPSVHIQLECAHRGGWQVVSRGSFDLCRQLKN